jgi:hypothetical protein
LYPGNKKPAGKTIGSSDHSTPFAKEERFLTLTPDGHGTSTYPNGDHHTGSYKNGKKSGPGNITLMFTFYYPFHAWFLLENYYENYFCYF